MGNDTETIYLGKVPPRESPLAGLSDVLAKGIELGNQRRQISNQGRAIKVQEDQLVNSQQARLAKTVELKYKIAKMESDQADTATKAVIDRMEKVGAHFADKQDEYTNWLTSEAGDFYKKQAKKYAPELMDEKGNPFLIDPKLAAGEKLNQTKDKLIKKVAAGTATDEEERAASMLTKFPPDKLVQLLNVLGKDFRFQSYPPEKKAKIVAEMLQSLDQSGTSNQQSSKLSSNLASSQPSSNDKDSFFTRFK